MIASHGLAWTNLAYNVMEKTGRVGNRVWSNAIGCRIWWVSFNTFPLCDLDRRLRDEAISSFLSGDQSMNHDNHL